MTSIFCDFDGTITNRDSIVFLTEFYGGGRGYRSTALARIESGEWSVHEAIAHELASVKISWEQAVPILQSEITLDPFFEGFVSWSRRRSLPLRVVSSGMRPVVELFLGHLGLEIYAHPVKISTDGWLYRTDPASMKVTVLKKEHGNAGSLVYIGDGTSDVCAIPYADHLFAKRYLAEYCEKNGVPYFPFDDFEDVKRQLKEIL